MSHSRRVDELAVIAHADVAGSTALVRADERRARGQIQDAYHRLAEVVARPLESLPGLTLSDVAEMIPLREGEGKGRRPDGLRGAGLPG